MTVQHKELLISNNIEDEVTIYLYIQMIDRERKGGRKRGKERNDR